MPSSNPLPPKENALFKRILVSNGRIKILCFGPHSPAGRVHTRRALMMKHFHGEKSGKRSLATARRGRPLGATNENPSRPVTLRDDRHRRSSRECRVEPHRTPPPLPNPTCNPMHFHDMRFLAEMLRTQTIQKWAEVCETDPVKSQVQRARGDLGDEGSHAELLGPQGRSLRSCAPRPQE